MVIPTGGFPRAGQATPAIPSVPTAQFPAAGSLYTGDKSLGAQGVSAKGAGDQSNTVGLAPVSSAPSGPGTSQFPPGQTNVAVGRTTGIGFDLALNYMRGGHKLKRTCWTGDEHIIMRPDRELGRPSIKNSEGHHWMPSQMDVICEDWLVVP